MGRPYESTFIIRKFLCCYILGHQGWMSWRNQRTWDGHKSSVLIETLLTCCTLSHNRPLKNIETHPKTCRISRLYNIIFSLPSIISEALKSLSEMPVHHREYGWSCFRKPLVKRKMEPIVSVSFPCSSFADCYLQSFDNSSEPTDTYHETTQLGANSAQFFGITGGEETLACPRRQRSAGECERGHANTGCQVQSAHANARSHLSYYKTCRASSITLSLGGSAWPNQMFIVQVVLRRT